MKGSDALAIGVGIGGGAVLFGKVYDAWPFTWDEVLTAVGRGILESKRKNATDAFDQWIVNRVTQIRMNPPIFEPLASLVRLNHDLQLELSDEEYTRILAKLQKAQIPVMPIIGPIIDPPGLVKKKGGKKGGFKRKAQLEFANGHHPTRLLSSLPNHKKRHPGRTGMNLRTRTSLGFYDELRVRGGTDQRAREVATERLPLKKNLPIDEAVKRNRRAVDRAVREYRNNGDWDYPKPNKSDATLK
jgi:hypothetical protein